MEELSLDNILDTGAIDSLFDNDIDEVQENDDPDKENENIKEKNETTEVDPTSLFDQPESVGSGIERDKQGKEEPDPVEDTGTSPQKNFYSSIAKALQEEGIFPDLETETVAKIKSPEDFAEVIEQQIQAKFDVRLKRIDDALNLGVEPSEIKKYEDTIQYLNSIDDRIISDESEKGEKLRQQLIYQDFLNRGYSAERAKREVQKSFNAGTDINDAKEALVGNKEFFEAEYNDLIQEFKEEESRLLEERKAKAEELKKSILEEDKAFGDIALDKATRNKVFDNISKPVYKDPDTGHYLTAIQKYQKENSVKFIKDIGLLFTLTDGFKNLDRLVKTKVRKEVNKGLKDLEYTINNSSRSADGNLKFTSGVNDDPEAFIGKGWNLDV